MRPRSSDLLVGLLFAASGCTGPRHELVEPTRVGLEDLRSISPDLRFSAIKDLVLAPGSIWVLDGAPPFVTRVPLNGGEPFSFGSEGEGPGEFLNPWAIEPVSTANGTGLGVWDMGNQRFSAWDTTGALQVSEGLSSEGVILARADITEVSYADPFRIRAQGDAFFFGHFGGRINQTGDMAEGSLRVVDRTLSPLAEVVSFSDHVDTALPLDKVWAAVPLWDVCGGNVALWSPRSRSVLWIDPDGVEVHRTSLPGPDVPIKADDMEAYLRRMARLEMGPGHSMSPEDIRRMARASPDRFVGDHPGPVDIRCEARGVAWVRLFGTSSDPRGKGLIWLRVSMTENLRGFEFPAEFEPMVFSGAGAFGGLEDPGGFQRLVLWKERAEGEHTDD